MVPPFLMLGFWPRPMKCLIKLWLFTFCIVLVSVGSLDSPVERNLILCREPASSVPNELKVRDAYTEQAVAAKNKPPDVHLHSSSNTRDRDHLWRHARAAQNYCELSDDEPLELEHHRRSRKAIRKFTPKDLSHTSGLSGIGITHKDQQSYFENDMVRGSHHCSDHRFQETVSNEWPPQTTLLQASAFHFHKSNQEPKMYLDYTGATEPSPTSYPLDCKKRRQPVRDNLRDLKRSKACRASKSATGSSWKHASEEGRMSRFNHPAIPGVEPEARIHSADPNPRPITKELDDSCQTTALCLQDLPDRSSKITYYQDFGIANLSQFQRDIRNLYPRESAKFDLVHPILTHQSSRSNKSPMLKVNQEARNISDHLKPRLRIQKSHNSTKRTASYLQGSCSRSSELNSHQNSEKVNLSQFQRDLKKLYPQQPEQFALAPPILATTTLQSNEPPIFRVEQESRSFSAFSNPRPKINESNNPSQRTASILQKNSEQSSAPDSYQDAEKGNPSQVQSDFKNLYPQQVKNFDVVPQMVATTIEQYYAYRRIVLHGMKVQPRHMRVSCFYSATEYLGDLEYKKLNLDKSIAETIDELHVNWTSPKLEQKKEHDISERDIICKNSSIGFATKTALYLINATSNMYEPPLFQSEGSLQKAQKDALCILKEIWKALGSQEENMNDKEAVLKARYLLSNIRPNSMCKKLTLAWLATGIYMKKIMPDILQRGYELKKQFRVLLTDQVLKAGFKIKLWDSIKPDWEALFPITVQLILPRAPITEEIDSMGKEILVNDDEKVIDLKASQELIKSSILGHKSMICDHQEGTEAFHLIRDYMTFRDQNVDSPPGFGADKRREFIFLTVTRYGKLEIEKLDYVGKEKELLTYIECALRKNYPNMNESLTKKDKAKLDAISYALRAALLHTVLINGLYSPPLFTTKKSLRHGQKKAFKIMNKFWLSLYIPCYENQTSEQENNSEAKFITSDVLKVDAVNKLNNITGKYKEEYWVLAWVLTSYWMREKFPKFYDSICSIGNIHRVFKTLIADIILDFARQENLVNSKDERCPFKIKKKFLLQRPA